MDNDIDGLPPRLRDLDEAAFLEFSKIFGPRLRRYFLSLGACSADAESLTVSVIDDIPFRIDRFEDRGRGSFAAWVFRLARNRCADDRRKTMQSLSYDVADRVEPVTKPRVERDIAAALATLSETDRSIMTARYFEGEGSFAAIGKKVGLTANATRVRHHRLLHRLSAKLAAYAPGGFSVTMTPTDEDSDDGC
jgi:RNA polymerase sigma factor (sigma-70 family)